MWGGHSCLPPLMLILNLATKVKINPKIGGQECPPHTTFDLTTLR